MSSARLIKKNLGLSKTLRSMVGNSKATTAKRTINSLEIEAQNAGAQFIGSKNFLDSNLTAIAAANFRLPNSHAETLPRSLRSDLENFYRTDLSALRIHRDRSAATAVKNYHANALTSGAHIYFAENQYQPNTKGGRQLIAHEVAHTIQQAARPTTDSRYQLRDIVGVGAVQCEWISPLTSTLDVPNLQSALDLHLTAPGLGIGERDVISRLRNSGLPGSTRLATFWLERAGHVETDTFDSELNATPGTVSVAVASALYDGLKINGHTSAAAKLLSLRQNIQTTFFSAETYAGYAESLVSNTAEIKRQIYRNWYESEWFGATGSPRFMLDLVQMFLLGPTVRAVAKFNVPSGSLEDTAATELDKTNQLRLGPNELYYVTVLVASEIEKYRRVLFLAIRDAIPGYANFDSDQLANIKLTFAQQLNRECDRMIGERADRLRAVARATSAGPIARETLILWFEDVVPALKNMAQHAISFWNAVAPFNDSLVSGQSIEGLGASASEILRDAATEFPVYKTRLTTFVQAILRRNADGSLPAPEVFATQRSSAVASLDTYLRTFERELADSLFDALPSSRVENRAFNFNISTANRVLPSRRRHLLAWLMWWAVDLRHFALQGYSTAADTNLMNLQRAVDANALATDVRDIFRVHFAIRVSTFAERAAWFDWAAMVDPVLHGGEQRGLASDGTAIQGDYVAFGSDWTLDNSASISRMTQDLPAVARGFEPMLTRDVVEFFIAQDYRNIIERLDSHLEQSREVYNLTDDPVLNQAFEEARALFRPQRYVIRDCIWITPWTQNQGRHVRDPRTPLNQLLRQHPLTRRLINRVNSEQGGFVAWSVNSIQDESGHIPVLWLMPTPIEMVGRLQSIRSLNEIILRSLPAWLTALELAASNPEAYSVLPKPDLPSPLRWETLTVEQLMTNLDAMTWWDIWRGVLEVRQGAERSGLVSEMRSAIRTTDYSATLASEREAAYQELVIKQRFAIAHERRRLIEASWRPGLDQFDTYSWDNYRILGTADTTIRRQLAEDVARLVRGFAVNIDSETEEQGHTAMAVLELANTIHEKLLDERKLYNIIPWVPLIDDAIFWLDGVGADAAVRDAFAVEEERGNATLFANRRTQLEAILTHMAEVLRENFMEWGIVGVKGEGTIEDSGSAHPLDREHRAVGRGRPFTIEGRTWEVLQVYENFTFHPGSFALRSMRNRAVAGSMLKIGSGGYVPEGEREATALMQVAVNEGPPIDLYANNAEHMALLTQMTWDLHLHSTLEQLGELAEAMETFGNLMMDAAELFPGAGQALAATRLLTGAMAFIGSDLPQMLVDIVTNPKQALSNLLDRLRNMMGVSNLLGYFLFDNNNFEGLIRAPTGTTRSRVTSGSSSRRLRRLVTRLQNFARGMGQVFVRMHGRTQDRRQQVEHYVQSSPRVVRIVQIVGDYYLVVAALADYLPEFQGDLSEVRTDFNPNDLVNRLDQMIAAIGEIQVPEEILPLNQLVDVLIDVIGHRLGGKYKLGVQILLQLLDFIGARQQVVDGIVRVLRDVGVTTDNVFPMWRDEIVPAVQNYLREAQQAIRNTLNDTFSSFQVPLNLAEPQPSVTYEENDFPEAAPSLEGDVQQHWQQVSGGSLGLSTANHLLSQITNTSGEPLPSDFLLTAQQRFGRNFSHVRIHQNTQATELTQALGAHALTSGSHVILNNNIEPNSNSRVMFHELAHVVQQTQAPSLSENAGRSLSPRLGRSRRGVRWDRNAEAQADAAAAAALDGSARHIALSSSGASDWQPSMIELLGQQFLRQLVDVKPIADEVADIDATTTGTGRRLIGRDVRRAVSHVGANLRTKFQVSASGLRTSINTFQNKLSTISAYLINFHPDIANAIEDIAIRASYEAEPARDGRPVRMALDIADFTRRLERYIFGKTGIMLDLHASLRGVGRDATFRQSSQPYSYAEVKFVFLADVHGNTNLWREALTHKTTRAGTQGAPIPESERAGWRTQIRAVLRDLGPSSSIWASNGYRFSHAIFAAAEELTRLQQTSGMGGTLPASELPSVDHYRNTTGTDLTAGHGNVRLHLGTYDKKGTGLPQSGTERESHHITQYLLVEYFHNGSGTTEETDQQRKGFPLLSIDRTAYGSDMHLTGTKPDRFRDIKIDELEQGRGGKMPTILLARPTHRRGNLHISPSADDFSDVSVSTQAGAVNHIYKNALPTRQRQLERLVTDDPSRYSQWVTYRDNPANNVSQHIFDAMQATYQYMKTYMQTQLKNALLTIERDYYNDLYAARHTTSSDRPLTSAHMQSIWEAAVRHNNEGDSSRSIRGLSDYGWRT